MNRGRAHRAPGAVFQGQDTIGIVQVDDLENLLGQVFQMVT